MQVAFNILGPAQAQFKTMGKSAKGVAAGLGLTAAMLLAAQSADAAQEVSQLAAGDNRTGIIATLFVPVIGWVLFNILGPAQAQLDNMGPAKTSSKKRGVAAAIGAGASLLMVQQADAASEIAQVTDQEMDTLWVPIDESFQPASHLMNSCRVQNLLDLRYRYKVEKCFIFNIF